MFVASSQPVHYWNVPNCLPAHKKEDMLVVIVVKCTQDTKVRSRTRCRSTVLFEK